MFGRAHITALENIAYIVENRMQLKKVVLIILYVYFLFFAVF